MKGYSLLQFENKAVSLSAVAEKLSAFGESFGIQEGLRGICENLIAGD